MKRIISFVLAFVLIHIILPIDIFAVTKIDSSDCGAYGNNVIWTLTDDGVLTVSGTGPMRNYTSTTRPLYSKRNLVKTIIIENGVTNIGGLAFDGCSNLTSVVIPSSVTSIEYSAFNGCASLTSISIPDSVTSLSSSVFYKCTGLTSITLPDSITSIGNFAFQECSSLTSIDIPDNITSIGKYIFYSCSSLESVDIPDGVTSIGDYSFAFCTNMTSVTIPDSVTNIGAWAFAFCSKLESVIIPNSVKSIGTYAFQAYSGLRNIILLSPDTEIQDHANTIRQGATIYSYAGSTAQAYAEKYNRKFVEFCDGNHIFGNASKLDDESHIRYCVKFDVNEMQMCSESKTEPHIWDDGVEGDLNTTVYTCTDCNAEHIKTNIKVGDVNSDSTVDKNDAIYLLYSVLFGDTQYPLNQTCDFNADGSVDKNDAIYLLYHALFGAASYPLN